MPSAKRAATQSKDPGEVKLSFTVAGNSPWTLNRAGYEGGGVTAALCECLSKVRIVHASPGSFDFVAAPLRAQQPLRSR